MDVQFWRYECFALTPRLAKMVAGKERPGKRSGGAVAAEADRLPGHMPHIQAPCSPHLLHGMPASRVVEQIAADIEEYREAYKRKTGKKPRFRKDQNVIVAGVVSFPVPRDLVDASVALQLKYRQWRTRVLRFLRARFGKGLRSVLEHTDESHLHLHFFCTPNAKAGKLNLYGIHAGITASADCGPRGSVPHKARRDAWKRAMSGEQLDFYKKVSWWFGHSLKGPGRQRLTREQLQAQRQQLRALEAAQEQARALLIKADREYQESRRARAKIVADLAAVTRIKVELDVERASLRQVAGRIRRAASALRRLRIEVPPAVTQALSAADDVFGKAP